MCYRRVTTQAFDDALPHAWGRLESAQAVAECGPQQTIQGLVRQFARCSHNSSRAQQPGLPRTQMVPALH